MIEQDITYVKTSIRVIYEMDKSGLREPWNDESYVCAKGGKK